MANSYLRLALTLNHSIRSDLMTRYAFMIFLPGYGLLIERTVSSIIPRPGVIKGPQNTQSTYDDVKNNDELKTQLANRQGLRLAGSHIGWTTEMSSWKFRIFSAVNLHPDVPDPNQEQTKPKPGSYKPDEWLDSGQRTGHMNIVIGV